MTSYFIPAPIGGLNYRDPIPAMPEIDATVLDNWYPETGYIRSRGGVTELCDLGSSDVQTLHTFYEPDSTGWLVGCTNNDVFEINPSSGVSNSRKGATTITSNYWKGASFAGRFYMANGVDTPIEWVGGPSNFTTSSWSGTGLTATQLYLPTVFKSRIYFLETFTPSIWYSVVAGTVGGLSSYVLTEYDVGPLLTQGGQLVAHGFINQTNDGLADLYFVLSQAGEVLVFSGDNPGSANWTLLFRAFTAPRVSQLDAIFYVENEAHILTYDGPVPVNQLLSGKSFQSDYTLDTQKVRSQFRDLARTNADGVRWNTCYFPNREYVLINVPVGSSPSNQHQYVMNIVTKAWCRWTGLNALCWASTQSEIYYGTSSGKVYKADQRLTLDEASAAQSWQLRGAYNYLGAPNSNKTLSTFQPIISVEKASGTSTESFRATPYFDFGFPSNETSGLNLFTSTGPYFNRETHGLHGIGKAVSLDLQSKSGGYSTAYEFRYYGSWVDFSVGGSI